MGGLDFALEGRVLGQIFLVACVLAMLSVLGIFLVLYGPIPVKRKVVIAPRLAVSSPVAMRTMPSLVAQLAPAPQQIFTPSIAPSIAPPVPPSISATIQGAPPVVPARPTPSARRTPEPPPLPPQPMVATPPPTPVRKPKGQKVQPMPRKRAAKGTASPFAPVVRSAARQHREEDMATNQVDAVTNQVVLFDAEEMTIDESR